MRELNVNELQEVSGGVDELVIAGVTITGISVGMTAFAVGSALASVGGASFAAATALGADDLGKELGSAIYDLFN
ncbi:bacteriocin [Alteromonas gilva]|uniref:Bacteriocin n=1 Tax=Alteromonas gilva TaxID=2987522 RepID=A0ABT5L5N8_9ALTE|nr:bacteriocin [Alteromonas gilva]MDC8832368.1 bacteriocin [Alteromonas gilva]